MEKNTLVNTTGKAGKAIETMLVQLGVSKGEFAARLSIVSSSVSRALRSETMELQTLEKYARVLECNAEIINNGTAVKIYRTDQTFGIQFELSELMETGKHNPNFSK